MRNMRQLRMLTILLQDIRSGVTDHQLAEVKVPLRPADTPEDGYWADASEISEALQSSPSRIDGNHHFAQIYPPRPTQLFSIGPAKVYTLRGKYRQIFMRISADNVLDCMSANIIVTPQRTLDIVVEAVRVLLCSRVIPSNSFVEPSSQWEFTLAAEYTAGADSTHPRTRTPHLV
jgi:hypothetical protein